MATGGEAVEIREGFLCPICLQDLGTFVGLQAHFQEEHATEDQDVIKSLKGLFGKAKKRILKNDYSADQGESNTSRSSVEREAELYRCGGADSTLWDPQEEGASRSHFETFRSLRNARLERYAAETNKLLIRLDKLLLDLPTDPVKKRAHEQNVVPWLDDTDVRLCPNCARSFHLARRKHHCRLCGGIMCNDCSEFLNVSYARKLLSPVFIQPSQDSLSTQSPVSNEKGGVGSSLLTGLRRSGSGTSLNSVLSVVDPSSGEPYIRLCVHCHEMLLHREELIELRTTKPILVQFYERLRSYIEEADSLAVMYFKMADSLNNGDSTYNLSDAQDLRMKLLKLAESVDNLSKKIAVLGTRAPESPPGGLTLRLQQTIRIAAATYLKDQLIGLPSLPTEEKLRQLRQQRRLEVQERVLQERERAAQEIGQPRHTAAVRRPNRGEAVVFEAGWGPVPESHSSSLQLEDPMVQQMNIIRGYIKQARAAHKYDEVAMLEANLKELKSEYLSKENERT